MSTIPSLSRWSRRWRASRRCSTARRSQPPCRRTGRPSTQARALLLRSHDLRLAVHLLRASLAPHGVAGLADGLRLIERLLEEQWDGVHPRLDAGLMRVSSHTVLTFIRRTYRKLKVNSRAEAIYEAKMLGLLD
ncbi:MAG: type VI secretion system ImpA family N-terminal domain-containing protein [Duganella sp.]